MKYFLTFMLLVFCVFGYTQSTFSKVYYDIYDYHDGLSMLNIDNSLVIAVQKQELFSKLGMLKLDYEGNILIEKFYNNEEDSLAWFAWPNSMAEASNGQIVVANSIGKLDNETTSYPLKYGLIAVFDENLDTLWTKTLKLENNNIEFSGHGAGTSQNNDFFICGQKRLSFNYKGYIAKYSSSGELLWEHDYNGNDTDEGISDLFENDNNEIFAIGASILPSRELVFKISEDGELLDSLNDSISAYHNNMTNIVNDEFVGYSVYYGGDYVSFRRYDDNLNTLEESNHSFSDAGNSHHNINFDNQGNIISCGGGQDYNLDLYVGYISKLSSSGELIWNRRFSHVDTLLSVQRFYGVVQTSDNGYAACGDITAIPGTGIASRLWVVKTDSMGCIVQGCDSLDNVSITNSGINNEIELFSIGANPISSDELLNIYLGTIGTNNDNLSESTLEFQLYNIQGELIKEFTVDGFGTTYILSLNGISSGNYILSLRDKNRVWQTEKVLIK